MTTTIAALAALAWLPPSTGTAGAQETTAQEFFERQALEYLQREDTTIEGALEALQREDRASPGPAARILRQVAGYGWWAKPSPRPAAELDAFADRLAEMAADATLPDDVRMEARFALAAAASSKSGHGYGTPYPRAFDLLIEVYEGGYSAALDAIASADPERGPAYVRGVLERSERPLLCPRPYPRDPAPGCEGWRWQDDARDTPWCEAGFILYMDTVWEAMQRMPSERLVSAAGYPRPIPEGLPEHIEDWHRRCR